MKRLLLIAPILMLTACASMQNGKTQEIIIKSQPQGGICTVTNDKGSWTVTSPDTVVVIRDSSDIQVYCAKGKIHGSTSFKSGASPNMGKAGLVGDLIDLGTGAAYEYNSSITVTMK